jgi:hypothetical protein
MLWSICGKVFTVWSLVPNYITYLPCIKILILWESNCWTCKKLKCNATSSVFQDETEDSAEPTDRTNVRLEKALTQQVFMPPYSRSSTRQYIITQKCFRWRTFANFLAFNPIALRHGKPHSVSLCWISGSEGGEHKDGCLQGCSAV